MNCAACGRGPTRPTLTTITLDSGPGQLTFRGVPASVCPLCGEEFLDDRVALELMKRVQTAASSGTVCQQIDYASAAISDS